MTLSFHEPGSLTLAGALGKAIWTIPGMLRTRAKSTPVDPALWSLSTESKWCATTWREYDKTVLGISQGLRGLALRPGDRVGILAPSSRYWDFTQMGILAAGGVVVGIDPYDTNEHINDIVTRCQLAGLVVEQPQLLDRLDNAVRQKLRFVISIAAASTAGVHGLDNIIRNGEDDQQSEEISIRPDDPATIIFTSGTTGTPKGIQYSHRQVCLAAASMLEAFEDIRQGSRLACWLPLSNLFQRMINICAIGRGAQTYYVEKPQDIMRYVGLIEPHIFIGVPRFYEKLYTGIRQKIEQLPSWQQCIVNWALNEGDSHASALRAGQSQGAFKRFRHALADRLVLTRLRGIMGRNLRYLVSGSAPMPRWLLDRFHGMGLLVLEAYGMSENIVPVAANRPDAFRFGTVGRSMPGSDVRLGPDNELLVRGPGVFNGYYDDTTEKSSVGPEGYLASGDFATIDSDGFITLTGRKSEIFKTSTGRRIAPSGIEVFLSPIPFVDHAVVIGAGHQFLVAILVVSAEATDSVASPNAGEANLLRHCERIRNSAQQFLAPLPDYQRPAGLLITRCPFTIAGGELTSNLKLRRGAIELAYRDLLAELYQCLDSANGTPFQLERAQGQVVLCSL
jgi:long-chain acyl-CoA synthetase